MIGCFWACVRLSIVELARSRLAWLVALYVGLVCALPWLARDVSLEGRPSTLAGLLHGITSGAGTLAAILASARRLPQDLKSRLAYTVLATPVSRGAYFLGRLCGVVAVLTGLALVFLASGAGLLAWADARLAPLHTERILTGPVAPHERTDQRVAFRFRLPPGAPREAACHLTLMNNPYWNPEVEVTFRAGSGAGALERARMRLSPGKRRLILGVPSWVLAGGGRELELSIEAAGGGLTSLFDPSERHRLVRAGREPLWLWAGDVACLWAEMLVLSAAAFALSTFVSWQLAASAALALALAANTLAFLKLLPEVLEPEKLREIFSPTIYRTHPYKSEGHRESSALARLARSAVPALLAALPDFQALQTARRIEDGVVTAPAEWIPYVAGMLPYLAVLLGVGALGIGRREPA